MEQYTVHTSFLSDFHRVSIIWSAQTAVIVIGHVIGITVAHFISLQIFKERKKAVLSQIPLAVLMIAYTVFGLWLLSTPSI